MITPENISEYNIKYVGSEQERNDIEIAYREYGDDIPKILKYIPFVESQKDKQRIIALIQEIKKSDPQKKRRLDNEKSGTKKQRIETRDNSQAVTQNLIEKDKAIRNTETTNVEKSGIEISTNRATKCGNFLEGKFTMPGGNFTPKKEKQKLIENRLLSIRNLFCKQAKDIPDSVENTLQIFNEMDNKYQCICLELITNKKKWYQLFKFSKNILFDIEDADIMKMFKILKENGFIDTDYLKESHGDLLDQLVDLPTLRLICEDIEKENRKIKRKEIIDEILKWCDNKTWKKTLLKEKILDRVGHCIKINEDFQQRFNIAYLSCTFANFSFSRMEDYFKSDLIDKDIFPSLKIDKYVIFTSSNEFVSYATARIDKNHYEELSDKEERFLYCKTIFEKLRATTRVDHGRFTDAPHLIKFTARAVYVRILIDAAKKLVDKYHSAVKGWLMYMEHDIKEKIPQEIGWWYYCLIKSYIKTSNYDEAAKLLIEMLGERKNYLSDIQLYKLSETGRKLSGIPNTKISKINKENIIKLLRDPIKMFAEIIVDICNPDYMDLHRCIERDENTGDVIQETFTLFFFDIIYNTTKCIPGTFVSNLQNEPLDMDTQYFYRNRKREIDQRLEDIESKWSDEELLYFLKKNYDGHSHELLICKIRHGIEILEDHVRQIGRKFLAKIYKRLAENFKEHREGLSDLLIWKAADTKSLVVVKEGKAKLSMEQTLWLNYLDSIGANVGIVRISSARAKKHIKKVK